MNRSLLAAAVAVLALAVSVTPNAETVAGVELRPVMPLDGEELRLARCGVRDTLWIEHYVVGLYVPPGTRAAAAVQDPRASKVLVVRILNAAHFPQRMPEKWREPLQAALPAETFARLSAAYERLRQGDTMMYRYSPGTGLTMTVNDETVVRAGHEVIDRMLQAWQRDEGRGALGELLQGHDC